MLWFESIPPAGAPRPADQYRHLALSAVGTHDLPPTAGYLEGAHNELRATLGLVNQSLDELNANDGVWIGRVLNQARAEGAFAGTPFAETDFSQYDLGEFEAAGSLDDLLVGLTRFIASTPSAMTVTNLVDMVGDRRIPNLSLIHISEPTRRTERSRMPSSA